MYRYIISFSAINIYITLTSILRFRIHIYWFEYCVFAFIVYYWPHQWLICFPVQLERCFYRGNIIYSITLVSSVLQSKLFKCKYAKDFLWPDPLKDRFAFVLLCKDIVCSSLIVLHLGSLSNKLTANNRPIWTHLRSSSLPFGSETHRRVVQILL